MDVLRILDNEIAARCDATMAQVSDWPCRRGCDYCCRHLADEPRLTRAEWERLDPAVTEAMLERVARLDGPPYVCPFLDQGACGVYAVRPMACRTYGFYVEREQGLYCGQIRERVERGELGDVVWGNQSVVERELDELGERIPLRVWFARRIDRR